MNGPKRVSEARKRAEKTGRRAEILAAASLMLRGYRILGRRYKTGGGEIDLIAKRNDMLVIAEVKARSSVDAAVEAVTPHSRRRIERAGHTFMAQNPGFSDCGVRYDIMAVTGWRVTHLTDAWREGE